MPDQRVWTAAELEQLTPDERHRLISEGFVTDLSTLDPGLVARLWAKGKALLEEHGYVSRRGDA